MPTYRYRCSDCGEEFELWQSIKDDAIRTHDEDGCGGEVERVLTPAGIVLKGSGFYKTDSRSSDSKRKSGDGSKPKDTGGSSEQKPSPSDSGSDTKSGDSTSSTTKTGDSKSTAGAAKPT
jgi:putative FmdB family regulatory protein